MRYLLIKFFYTKLNKENAFLMFANMFGDGTSRISSFDFL